MRIVARSMMVLSIFLPLCGQAFGQSSEIPFSKLEGTARAHSVLGVIDQESFDRAIASYPTDDRGGKITVRVGRYMMWRIVHLFSSGQRVQRIALVAFEERCALRGSQFSETVICRLTALVSVTYKGRTRSANLAVTRNVGRFVRPKPGEDMAVVHSGLASTIDETVKGVQRLLRQMGAL